MVQKQLKNLPIGIQTFSKIIEGDYLYVDKTRYIYDLVSSGMQYCFLSRPRRFGKSLLTSTFRSYFEGNRNLFKGLAIDGLETDWTCYPVLYFDMSLGKHMDKDMLLRFLGRRLEEYERKYDIINPAFDCNDRLTELIRTAYKQTGHKVVVLIDEYDAPLLDVAHEDMDLSALRNVMRNFYSPLKGCDRYLRFVFLTGITKFSQLSIFSELNNLKNISMDRQYAGICGITSDELMTQMSDYIDRLATMQAMSRESAVSLLRNKYDGYHFSASSPDIYNPFSLLNAFYDNEFGSYWFSSGTPTYLIEMLRKFDVRPSDIGRRDAMASEFDAPTESMTSVTPLLYQSGYLTIKEYAMEDNLYTLDIPNQEIRIGLMESLLPNYLYKANGDGMTTVAKMYRSLRNNDLDGMLCLLQRFLLTVPYCDNTNYEGYYQQMLYIIFSLLGRYVDVEVRTSTGRVDMVMLASDKLYLFELKLNKSAESALSQIALKDYPSRFSLSGLPIVKVGIGFDMEKRTIGDWKIED